MGMGIALARGAFSLAPHVLMCYFARWLSVAY